MPVKKFRSFVVENEDVKKAHQQAMHIVALKHKPTNARGWVQLSDIARHPNTSPETLHHIASFGDRTLISSVLKNPNTSDATLKRLTRSKRISTWMDITSHPNASGDTLARLQKKKWLSLDQRIVQHPNVSTETLKKIVDHYRANAYIRKYADIHKIAFNRLLDRAANREEYDRDTGVVYRKKPSSVNESEDPVEAAHAQALEKLADTSKDHVVLGHIALNEKTPPHVLSKLSRHKHSYVLNRVALNPNLPLEDIERLQYNVQAMSGLAVNASTPHHILKFYVNHGDPNIRINVSHNRSLKPEDLEYLSRDKSPFVREGVARNPSTPDHVLVKLSNDGDSNIRNAASRHAAHRRASLRGKV